MADPAYCPERTVRERVPTDAPLSPVAPKISCNNLVAGRMERHRLCSDRPIAPPVPHAGR